MENVMGVVMRADMLIGCPAEFEKIRLPALKELLQHVSASMAGNNYYTKHSAHTKSSTKGCVMGCIGG
jgi:hypothetical protein